MTQLVFDLELLDRFFDRFGGPSPIPVLVGICPIWSYRFALRLHNELPGIVVPQKLQEQLHDAGPNAGDVGMAWAKDLYEACRERAAGVYLVAPYRQPLNVLDLVS
jgi:methionine synthase / methylenetetrahydrofolate reductase (NADH)